MTGSRMRLQRFYETILLSDMLTARKYKDRITLVLFATTQDEYGKEVIYSSAPEDVLHTFANVIQSGNSRVMVENANARQEAYRFTIRYTDKAFNAVRWRDKIYVVQSTENVNQQSRELVIYAQRAE